MSLGMIASCALIIYFHRDLHVEMVNVEGVALRDVRINDALVSKELLPHAIVVSRVIIKGESDIKISYLDGSDNKKYSCILGLYLESGTMGRITVGFRSPSKLRYGAIIWKSSVDVLSDEWPEPGDIVSCSSE
jgi:hypothetical protein